jgi:hypothetical protein
VLFRSNTAVSSTYLERKACKHTSSNNLVKILVTLMGNYCYTGLGRSIWLQDNEASQISRQLAQEGGKVVGPMHWPAFTSSQHAWYSFMLEAESTQRPWCRQEDSDNEKSQ